MINMIKLREEEKRREGSFRRSSIYVQSKLNKWSAPQLSSEASDNLGKVMFIPC